MRRHHLFVAALAAFVLPVVACVDLFHGTDFETLCTQSPPDPACNEDAGADVAVDNRGHDTGADSAPAPHPDFCAWSSSDAHTHALEACAWLGACEHPTGESIFGSCVVRAQLAYDCHANPSLRPRGAVDAFWGCLSTVKSCDDVDRCVFPGGQQDCSASAGPSNACGSSGNEAVRFECSGAAGRAKAIEPCVMLGKSCTQDATVGVACTGSLGFGCTTAGCSGTEAAECPTGTPTVDNGVDCAGYGAGECSDVSTYPACVPGADAGSSCSGNPIPKCDGAVVTSCVNGTEVRIDCGALGLPCDVGSPISPLDLGAACKKVGTGACLVADKCTGGFPSSFIESCGHGLIIAFNCASAGLGICAVDDAGHAACGVPE